MSLDRCGILNVSETWDRGAGAEALVPVDESLVNEKAIQSRSNITSVSNDFIVLG